MSQLSAPAACHRTHGPARSCPIKRASWPCYYSTLRTSMLRSVWQWKLTGATQCIFQGRRSAVDSGVRVTEAIQNSLLTDDTTCAPAGSSRAAPSMQQPGAHMYLGRLRRRSGSRRMTKQHQFVGRCVSGAPTALPDTSHCSALRACRCTQRTLRPWRMLCSAYRNVRIFAALTAAVPFT